MIHRRLLANNGLSMAGRRRLPASARASLPLTGAQDPSSAMLAEHQAEDGPPGSSAMKPG
jgi:hypothetical protein